MMSSSYTATRYCSRGCQREVTVQLTFLPDSVRVDCFQCHASYRLDRFALGGGDAHMKYAEAVSEEIGLQRPGVLVTA